MVRNAKSFVHTTFYVAPFVARSQLQMFVFSETALLVSLAIIGRFGVTVAYNSGAQYATELIPTCVRGQGVAAVHVAGYALTFFSSYILYLVRLNELHSRKAFQIQIHLSV